MIYVLMSSNSFSCAKALKFFKNNSFKFTPINIIKNSIDSRVLKDILYLTDGGFEDIIATRSDFIQKSKINIDDLTVSELISLIQHEPTILKKPIILQYNKDHHPYRLMVGYNSDDIEIFLRDKDELESSSYNDSAKN